MASYAQLRERHLGTAAALAPTMLGRLSWPAERLSAHRTAQLRRLVRVARDLSPWHRKRLADVHPDEIDETTLTELPVMTKDDLMENFDEIVTDSRLRREVVETHLASLGQDAYLYDRYHACASGGSSGRRGVFVYDWDGWAVVYWSLTRHVAAALRTDTAFAGAPPRVALVAAEAATHMSSAVAQTFAGPAMQVHRFPVTAPLPEIVAGLAAAQPTVLVGYASALHLLAAEARAGLKIRPRWVVSASEPLLPEARRALEEAFEVPVGNQYATSEAGGVGGPCRGGPWLHLADDLVVVEPVDLAGTPVPTGVRSDRLYLTNLFNHALPLLRFELTDQITVLDLGAPCPCGCTHRRIADPYGRLDDVFRYGPLAVHPHVFRAALSRRQEVVEYQVRQSRRGAQVLLRCAGPVDMQALAAELAGELARLGLPDPDVGVGTVDALPRQASGKLKRFVPLGG